MGLGQINIKDELLSRTRNLVNAVSYLTLRNHLLGVQSLTPVVQEINLLLTQEYESDKKEVRQKKLEDAFAMQIANDAKEAQEDMNEESNDQTLYYSYQQEIANLQSRRGMLANEVSHLQHELLRLKAQIAQLNNAYTMPTTTFHAHEHASHNHTYEHANIHVHVHHPHHHHHIHEGSLNNLHLWSQINGLQNEYSDQNDRLKTSESNLKKLDTRLAELDALNRELPQRLNRRKMRQQERVHRALIRQHKDKSLDQLSQKSKQDLDNEIKHQNHLLDSQLHNLKLELSKQSYPCFLHVLNDSLESSALAHLDAGEQGKLKIILKHMQAYHSKKAESETLIKNINTQTLELSRLKNLFTAHANKIQANNHTVMELQRKFDLSAQDDQRLHHHFTLTVRKKNTAWYSALGAGLGAVATFYATIFFTINLIFFLIPSIMALAAVTSLIFGAVYQAKKSALQEEITENDRKMTNAKLEVRKLTKQSQDVSDNNLSIQQKIDELEQQIPTAKMKLRGVEIAMEHLLQEAKDVGDQIQTAVTPFHFFRTEPTPSAPPLAQSTSIENEKVTPF